MVLQPRRRPRAFARPNQLYAVLLLSGTSRTLLIYSAAIEHLTPQRLTRPVLSEVKYGTQEVLSEFRVVSDQPGNVGYRVLAIDLELAF
ncbi:hypothetical protein ACFS3C_12425 [Azotobacter vinelandii]|nr:hypothetical protein [Azotobacter vinelandii]GLK60473.1 hypothetical protein GCM10017624_26340 [Azotobacter vinelandii]SFY30561.1 hypothetical protein SAMN04244547_04999 [Azotobacter vinelandii]